MQCSDSPLIDAMTAEAVAASEDGVKIRLRLCMLRSPSVEDYAGPNKFEQDVVQILNEYSEFAAGTEGWELLEKSEKGVLAVKNDTPETSSVRIALLGLDGWRLNLIRRDAAIPHEPFMEMRIDTSEEAEEDGSLVRATTLFVDFMTRYSGETYESQDLPRLRNEDDTVADDAEVDQSSVRPPSISSVLQRVFGSQDRPFLDTSSLTDWLLPEMLLQYDEDDLGVAGTTPLADRPSKEGYFGVYALNQQPPPTLSPEDDPSERLWDATTNMGKLSEEERDTLRRRGLNEMVNAPDDDDDDDDAGGDPKIRRAKGRDFVEYKGREEEDLVQDGLAPEEDDIDDVPATPVPTKNA